MQRIIAKETKLELTEVIDMAKLEPVVVQRQERDIAVVMSIQEYERLVHLNVSEFQRFCDHIGESAAKAGLNEKELKELLESED